MGEGTRGSTRRSAALWSAFLLSAASFVVLLVDVPTASAAPSVDRAEVCAQDDGVFRFSVDLTEPDAVDNNEIIFRLNADDGPFPADLERFAVNFDADTAAFTRVSPVVESFGSPSFDRWEDGPVEDFVATSLGSRAWRLEAGLAPGANPFVVGDTVWGVIVRTFSDGVATDTTVRDLSVAPCVVAELPNTPPVAVDDFAVTARDTTVIVPVLDNDIDEDGDPLRIVSADLVDVTGPVLVCETETAGGVCTLSSSSPGKPVTFTYLVTDEIDTDEGTATVDILQSFGGFGTATVDGVRGEGEWDGAGLLQFEAATPDGPVAASLLFMNDGANLYLGLEAPVDSTGKEQFQESSVQVFFDDGQTGTFDLGDDSIALADSEKGVFFADLFLSSEFGYLLDEQQDGAGDVGSDTDVGVSFYELSHPLSSGDDNDIDLTPGDSVGFAVEVCFGSTCTNVPNSGAPLTWVTVVGGVEDVTITPSSPTLETGFGVPIADIPTQRLLAGVGSIVGAPLGAIDLDQSPLGAISPRGAPLGAIPLGAIPLGAIGFGSVVLSDVAVEGGWEPILAGTVLEGRPLQTVTLQDVVIFVPRERLAALRVNDLTIDGTALADLSVATLALGDVPLSTFGITDAECGCDASTTSVLDLELSGSSIAALPLGAIPLGAIPLGAIGDLDAAPLGAIPLGAIPLGAIPLGAIGDVQSAPLGAIPLGAIGDLAAAPLGAIPLGAIPLGAIPLGAIPLGAIPLGAIPLGAIPLGAIDVGGDFCAFHDAEVSDSESCAALGIDPLVTTVLEYLALLGASDIQASPLGAIPVGAIPLGAIPLGAIDISGMPLGAIPLGAIDLAASPLGAIPLGAIPLAEGDSVEEVCSFSTTSPCDETTTLAQWAAGLTTDVASTPLGAITIDALPLGAIPLGAIDLTAVKIAGVPLGAIPLGAIDLEASPLGAIPLGAISGVCSGDTGSATTLLEAATLGACAGATVGDLVAALGTGADDFTLADVLGHLTLAFLGELAGFDGLTFGEIIIAILLAGDFPWEDLPLDRIEVRDVACGGFLGGCLSGIQTLEYLVEFRVTGDVPLTGEAVRITIPEGFLYVEGSSRFIQGSGDVFLASPRDDPHVDGNLLTFDVGTLAAGDWGFSVHVLPGFELETVTASASVGFGATAQTALSGPVEVVQAFEPNDRVGQAVPAEADTLYVTHIGEPEDQDWWRITPPGEGFRVSVFLSNLAGDIDTFVYRPATAPVSGEGTERQIPLASAPLRDDGVDFRGRGTQEPELVADSPIDGSLNLGEYSVNRGIRDEKAEFLQRDPEGTSFDIQVAGYQGAFSTSPYVLRVKYERKVPIPECTPRSHPAMTAPGSIAPADIPGGTATLFLTNWQRMEAHDGEAVAEVQASLADVASFLYGDGAGVNGAVVPIESIPGVADAFNAWDENPCDPTAANEVVGKIAAFVQEVAEIRPTLRHVSILGSDELVPFYRADDTTVIANEGTYTEGFGDNALFGSLFTRHYLTDAPYGDLDPIPWLDRFAYIPDLGIGRVVEDAGHILDALTTFLDNQGTLDPTTAATAGYDFLTDGAVEVRDGLAGLTNLDPEGNLLTETWTRTDLLEIAYGDDGQASSAPADVISPNAHYDHHRALPAIGNLTGSEEDLFEVGDIQMLELAHRIVFTMGCHSGLNVPDAAGGIIEHPTDWAEVYGELRTVYVGNTGYGYGDTVTVALSEQVMANLAARLDGTYTVGQALSAAKQEQFGKAGLYGIYDLKSIEEATLYGLPFWRIGPGGASAPTLPSDTGPVATEPITGLPSAPFGVAPSFEENTTPLGTFFSSDGETQFLHWRPIQPRTGLEVTQQGLVATGVLLTGLESEELELLDAVFARPRTTDQHGREPEIESEDVVFPTTFATIGTFGQLNPSSVGDPILLRQRVNLIPGQYVGILETPIQRLFRSVDGLVHYVTEENLESVDWTPPRIASVDADVVGGQVVFRVEAFDAESGVSRVVALFRSSETDGLSEWTLIDLVEGSDGVWTGGGTFGNVSPPIDYIVQAVNGDGVVGISTFKGELHRAEVLPPPPGDITCNGDGCTNDWYTGSVTIGGPDGAEASVDGGAFQGLSVEVSGDGLHTVVIRRADGSTDSFVVAIDGTPPTLLPGVDGAVYEVEEVVEPTEVCVDALSGVVTCGPIATDQTGAFTVTLSARDGAGNTVDLPFTYYVVDPLVLDASPALVQLGESTTLTTGFTLTGHAPTQRVDWGDGEVDVCSPTEGSCSFDLDNGVGGLASVTVDHTYAEPGVYRVFVELAHGDRRVQREVFEFVVVYDPEGGFVTGGGWIDSPAGAYVLDPELTGKATFGFVSRYRKGASVPTGKTEFQFRAASLRFKSTEYEWLVVSGSGHRAQFKGIGTINGSGNYGFMVTVIDEANTASMDVDRFRIKIWDRSDGDTVVYDNELGASDDSDPTTAILGGSIVIHTR